MDIVFFSRPGHNHEELRYALRSTRLIPHNAIHIIGTTPTWARNVNQHEREPTGNKYATTQAHFRYAIDNPTIPDTFIWWHDDTYLLKPVETIPIYNRGSFTDHIKETVARHPGSRYGTALKTSLQHLQQHGYDDPLSFEVHIPMVVTKNDMTRALDFGQGLRIPTKRTFYHVLRGDTGETITDVKMRTIDEHPPQGPWLSSMDDVFRYGAGNIVKWVHPTASPYETDE